MVLKMRNFLLLAMAMFLGFTSCNESVQKPASEEINIWLKRDPAKLNPIVYPSSVAREIYQYILTPLADFHPETLELHPILIKEIPQMTEISKGPYKGGLSFQFEILAEAVWDDGQPITGHDYEFTMKAIKNPMVQASGWRGILEDLTQIIVDKENPKKFEVIYSKPYMLALEAVSTINLYPAHIYDPTGAMKKFSLDQLHSAEAAKLVEQDSSAMKFSNEMNSAKFTRDIVKGSGPYQLSQWESDQYLVLTRQEEYWGAKFKDNPFLQARTNKLIFKIIKDENAAMGLLKTDALQIAGGVSSQVFTDLQKDETIKDQFNFFSPQLIRQYYMLINHQDKILKDVNVRKALQLITDVDQMISNFENGLGTRQHGPFHNTKTYYSQDLKNVNYDIEAAKKILSEAGWNDSDNDGVRDKIVDGMKEDLVVEILISKRELGRKISLMMQEAAQKAGIKIELNTQANATINQRKKSGQFQLVTAALTQEAIADDPYNKWHSDSPRNEGKYSNSKVDALIEEIRNTVIPKDRHALYLDMQKIVYEDAGAIFLYSPKERIVCSAALNAKGTAKRPGYMANTFSFK